MRVGERETSVARAEIELDGMVIAEKRVPIKAGAKVGDDNPVLCWRDHWRGNNIWYKPSVIPSLSHTRVTGTPT